MSQTGTHPEYERGFADGLEQANARAYWAIAYHTNSNSPRARKWYYVARIVQLDGKWWEVYWHSDISLRSDNKQTIRKRAEIAGLYPLQGVFTSAPSPHTGSQLVWSRDKKESDS